MRHKWQSPIAAIAAVAIVGLFCAVGASPPQTRLPGAAAIIDAAEYPTIQAAIDALPEAGGVVRIPPGTFEIAEPLIIGKSDVTIEGCGTAAHIKNINTEGKSALILQHPDGGENRNAELWRIRLANLRITGNEKSGHGIEARRINEIFIEGVTVVGNLFAGLRPKALTVKGKPSEAVLFCGNMLADAEHDCDKLDKSLVNNNLGLDK